MNRRAVSPDRRVAAEWEPQACVWISWPHNKETWPGRFESIPEVFTRWITAMVESTAVRILAASRCEREARARTAGLPNVEIVPVETDDCWVRDYGPSFVLTDSDQQLHGVNWNYNAWGGKYPPWEHDNAAALQICKSAEIPCVVGSLTLEGGALEFDGRGRLLTTPDCLLNPNRNPGFTQQMIVDELHRQFGVTEIVWLDGGGIAGDDTDGHIDQLARFVDRRNVVVAISEHGDDPNAAGLQDNFRQLQLWGASTEPNVDIHRLPLPPPREIKGQRVPESYCNFLRLGPERLLVPTFGVSEDDFALGLLAELTGADVIGVDCRELVWGLGTLHCASRDQPATARAKRQ